MKKILITIFCLYLFIGNPSPLSAQSSILDRAIEFSDKAGTFQSMLEEVSKQTGILFSYINNQVPLDKKIILSEKKQTVRTLLDKLTEETGLEYKTKGNKVLIFPKEKLPNFTISGIIRDSVTGETLIGATVYIRELKTGVASNAYGFYSITIPPGTYTIISSSLGSEDFTERIVLDKNLIQDIHLSPSTTKLEEVIISNIANDRNITSTEMSVHEIPIQAVKNMPGLAGEPDVMKSIQMLPGITTIGEGSTGIFVRGGGIDQNLVLLDEAPVYNPSHFLGFLSVFNPDALKDIKIYKGGIPAEYGGRASSVMDIKMKEGDSKNFRVSGGTGLMGGARLTIENPVDKGRGSFILSGRRTFADPFLWAVGAAEPLFKGTKLYFYDFNAKFNYKLDEKNKIYLSGYFGRDINKIPILNSNINWGNVTGTLRWNHLFNQRLFSNFSFIYSKYDYNLSTPSTENSFSWSSQIQDFNIESDFTFYANPSTTLKFGLNSIRHQLNPGSNKIELGYNVPHLKALEHAIYLSAENKISKTVNIEAGLRYSLFQNIGKATVFKFNQAYQPINTLNYPSGRIYHTYGGLEPRLGVNFRLNDQNSIKANYNLNRQYLHMLTNASTSFTSFDIWYPSGPNIKPLISHQIAIGYYKNFSDNMFETSLETYYKHIMNQLDFREHASLLFNPYLEGELRRGKANAYGLETFIRKKEGVLTGWASYTYSRSLRRINDINEGKTYASLYDQPHKFTITASYEISPRWNISANWIYNTGTPINLPVESFIYEDQIVPVYSERNSYRLPDYHRMDLSLTWRKKRNVNKKFDFRSVLSVYNVYGRLNPFTYYIGEDSNHVGPGSPRIIANRVSLFSIVPTLSFIFTFKK